jgi:shikimate kinase
MKIFLIGLPGSGKTTLGRQLADNLRITFVDLDNAIEQREGLSVTELFQTKKEAYFRQVESDVLTAFCQSADDFVVATGGGTPCFHNNMALMNRAGKTIFLDVPARIIAQRLSREQVTQRPLLLDLSQDALKDKIEFLRTQRLSFYRQAQHSIAQEDIGLHDLLAVAGRQTGFV